MFYGSIVALVTPMRNDGSIDLAALADLVDCHIKAKTSGLVVMGTTGESALVSDDELISAVQAAINCSAGKISIIAGCGGVSTHKTINLVEKLNPLNPDGFLCVTPYYVKPTQSGLLAHFSAVADSCKAPLILYNVPGRTAVDMTNDTVKQLSEHPNIVGIKDATGDLARAKSLINDIGPTFNYLSGDDETALEFMQLGGHGVITVTGNLAPADYASWTKLMLEKKLAAAADIFNRFKELNSALFIESNPIPVKWALSQLTEFNPTMRLPLTQPSKNTKQMILDALKKSQLI